MSWRQAPGATIIVIHHHWSIITTTIIHILFLLRPTSFCAGGAPFLFVALGATGCPGAEIMERWPLLAVLWIGITVRVAAWQASSRVEFSSTSS